ncbi:hypothetical protein [Dactylosporangium sp. NPDC048998]|uniref:hypothetical protein n=1 Tax=Dactylosporangium sp. NPDC048998 TaxID=3363976 RepID=UPI00371013CA
MVRTEHPYPVGKQLFVAAGTLMPMPYLLFLYELRLAPHRRRLGLQRAGHGVV